MRSIALIAGITLASFVTLPVAAFAPEPGGSGVSPKVEVIAMKRTSHVDAMHGFQLDPPADFAIEYRDVGKLTEPDPRPVAALIVMNPTMAASSLAGMEPADLEIRVYESGGSKSLEAWRETTNFASTAGGFSARPYRNQSFSGLQVCASTMIAPGCSVYVLSATRVYQLTAATRAGEAMIETFRPQS